MCVSHDRNGSLGALAEKTQPADLSEIEGRLDEPARETSFAPVIRRGTIWALCGYGGSQLLRLGGNLVLWRLLHPEAFGLMAIVNVFMQGLHMFSDVGIGPSIIQNSRGDQPEYLNTAWTIQVVRGVLLFLVACLAAAPVANFYGQPELAALIPMVAVGALLSGFNSTRLFSATRHIALSRVTLIELAAQLSGLTVMIAFALIYRSIWALVIGGAVTAGTKLALSHSVLVGVKNRFRWDKPSALVLLKFGRWIFLSTLLGFAVDQSDRLIFGKLIPMSLLGVYSIALMWATLPMQVVNHVFNAVMFPMLSRVNNEGKDPALAFRDSGTPWLVLGGWLSACLLSGGPLLVRFLYDDRATEAGSFMQILAAGTWFGILSSASSTTLFARGVPKWVVAASLAKLFGMAAFIPLGMAMAGFPGAVGGFAASEVLSYAVVVVASARLSLKDWRQDFWLSLFVGATALLGFATNASARTLLGLEGRLGAFLEGVAVLIAVSAAWAFWFWMQRQRTQRAQAARQLG